MTWPTRSILVNPGDLVASAQKISTECHGGATWASTEVAHDALYKTELGLRDLLPGGKATPRQTDVVVLNPTLLETTAAFAPSASRDIPYLSDPGQILRRVIDHTRFAKASSFVNEVGDPNVTPFAIMGLEACAKPEAMHRYLQCQRFARLGLDAVVVDLTESGRSSLAVLWDDALQALLLALDCVPGRRPPLVVTCEDAYTLRRASKMLRIHGNTLKPVRRGPIEIGVYLNRPGMIGPASVPPQDLPTVAFEADIKDASLGPLRAALLAFGNELREVREPDAAKAVGQALNFLRRSVCLPFGMDEACGIAEILFDGGDDLDSQRRAQFLPNMALAKLASVAEIAPSKAAKVRELVAAIQSRVAAWRQETPVSAKLARMLDTAPVNGTTVAFASRTVADLFLLSDRALRWRVDVVTYDDLAAHLRLAKTRRLVVVGPTPDALKTLLTCADVPQSVCLLGDAAGVGLLLAALAPVGRLAAFAPLAARAAAIHRALARGGADETLDFGEATFSIATPTVSERADFTRSDEGYHGDTITIRTGRGEFLYRPGSTVLVHSPSEMRPFVPQEARRTKIGDDILALTPDIQETLRRAIAGSRKSRSELEIYHKQVAARREATPGVTLSDKARHAIEAMRRIDPSVTDSEWLNVRRWLSADLGTVTADSGRQPGAARQWQRFKVFWQAAGYSELLARAYWDTAIVPTRSYRAQEGHAFNQRVTQFVLDPEGTSLGAGQWAHMPQLWQLVEAAVDEVEDIIVHRNKGYVAHG